MSIRETVRTVANIAIGALVAAAISAAIAATGQPPTPSTGPGLVDGTWLNGLAGGQNMSFQSGITASGTNQATSFQLPAGIYMFETDTVASGTGVALPECVAGTE